MPSCLSLRGLLLPTAGSATQLGSQDNPIASSHSEHLGATPWHRVQEGGGKSCCWIESCVKRKLWMW